MSDVAQQHTAIAKNQAIDREKWCLLVKEWDASKENQKEYCCRLGISLNTFSYVKAKLMPKENSREKSKFIPVHLTCRSQEKTPESDLLIIENPKGIKLKISPYLPLDQLIKLFRLVGW